MLLCILEKKDLDFCISNLVVLHRKTCFHVFCDPETIGITVKWHFYYKLLKCKKYPAIVNSTVISKCTYTKPPQVTYKKYH